MVGMKHRIAFAAALLAGTACSAQPQGDSPVLRRAAGSRPANRAETPLPLAATPIGRFDQPFAMAFLPDGSLLVSEKGGRLKLRWTSGKVTNVEDVPAVAAGGQGGLLDVAVAPQRARTGHAVIYLTYAEPAPDGGSQLALARATLSAHGYMGSEKFAPPPEDLAWQMPDLQVIWRSGSAGKGGQFGAVIAFAPDGQSLFLASGERQRFTPAQDPDQALGKIVHLTLDGKPWPGNPGAGKTGAASVGVIDPPANTVAAKSAKARTVPARTPNTTPAETWTSGHRNPYGLAFDAGGRLWEVEMGPKGGDELNLLLPGRNYGWPNASNGDNYDGTPIPDHRAGDGYEAPRAWWNPSISPGGMMIYSGAMFPEWRGSAFIAALSAEALIRVPLDGERAGVADQWSMGARIRDVAQAPDGAIWVLEDGERGSGGRLLRLTKK